MGSLSSEMERVATEMSKVTPMLKNSDNPENFNIDNVNPKDLIYQAFQVGLEEDPVAVIIDGANFYHYARELGINIDFNALSRILSANFPNLRAKYYITSEHIRRNEGDNTRNTYDDGHSFLRPLLDFLRYSRYTVRTRPIEITEDTDRQLIDSSMDVEIVTELFTVAKWAKHIIFFGSSKKFALPLTRLKEQGIIITVVASVKAKGRSVSDDLRRIDNFVDIDTEFFRRYLNNKTAPRRNYIPGVGNLEKDI